MPQIVRAKRWAAASTVISSVQKFVRNGPLKIPPAFINSEAVGGTPLTIGKGVVFSVDRDSHVLPDGQDVPPTDF